MWLSTALLFGFFGLEAFFVRIAQLGDLRQRADAFLGYVGCAFLIYLGMVWLISRSTPHPKRATPPLLSPSLQVGENVPLELHRSSRRSGPLREEGAGSSRWLLFGIVAGGVVFRLTLVGLTPTLSDDIYRYLWDGRVQHAGINPYRYAPQDEALAHLRTEEWHKINHKDIPTIYPPLMQLAFRLGVWLSPTCLPREVQGRQAVLMQKTVFLVCDLGIVVLLLLLLPRWGISPLMSLIYAWHPLVVVEVAGSGHNDPLGVLWLLAGLALWKHHRKLAGTIAFSLTFLSKFTTAILLPFYALRSRRLLLWFVAVVVAGYLPFLRTPHLIAGLGHYSEHWEFNSSVYSLLQSVLREPLLARILCGLALMVVGGILASRTDDLLHYTLRMIQTAIVLTPVLEPWYLLWLIPLLCVRPSWGWLGFSGFVGLSYMVLVRFMHEGIWQLPTWVKWVEYAPLYGWLIMCGLRRMVRLSRLSRFSQLSRFIGYLSTGQRT